MGTRGPIPKRSDQRLGNVTKAEKAAVTAVPKMPAGETFGPALDLDLEPLATRWYDSLRSSAQSVYYQDSDWATAAFVAQGMSDYLRDSRRSAQKFAAVMSAMTNLLATEGDRRRVRMEVETSIEDPASDVAQLDDYRSLYGA